MAKDGDSGSERPAPTAGSGRSAVYDSFVVRLWRTPGSAVVRRVEVEHVQSGVVASAGEVELAWVLAQLDGALETNEGLGVRSQGSGTTEGRGTRDEGRKPGEGVR
jgi:hypothetical protein